MSNTPHTERIVTGFSKPKIALYQHEGNQVSYSGCVDLAIGVDVNLSPTYSDQNIFYGNNGPAASAPPKFTGGACTYNCSDPIPSAMRMMYGLPDAGQDGWTPNDDTAKPPYLGTGFIVRYQDSDGEEFYVPTVLCKTKAKYRPLSAATQTDTINFQTANIEFSLFRDDSASHRWSCEGAEYATEAEAEEALEAYLGVQRGNRTTTDPE